MSAEQQSNNASADYIPTKSLLSDKALIEHMRLGSVVIEPFNMENLSTSSYDVTLGRYFFRESAPEPGMGIYNPYSQSMVQRVWGKYQEAEEAGEWMSRTGIPLENISPGDRIIWLKPGETILGHTNEYLGGRHTVTTMMKARSSLGRNFIEVCKCAGWGDVGYVNRWTMEITNNSTHYSIPLVVGRRIAQIVFFSCDPILDRSYESTGKYQTTSDLQKLFADWHPDAMLPQMFKDREIANGPSKEIHAPRATPSKNKHEKKVQESKESKEIEPVQMESLNGKHAHTN